jgi:2-oxo-4-hydroxy-4-carboxy-5-ureidoimidazoline decarboxylase
VDLPDFNAAPAAELTPTLLACCDVPHWAATVRDDRPYADLDALLATADRAARRFSPADVDRALGAHPRIGEQPDRDGAEADWSRDEQSSVGRDPATQRALAEGNRAYEERFGHVFLIFASGRSPDEILAAARQRMGNDEAAERAVVADELRKIARLRLERLLDALG